MEQVSTIAEFDRITLDAYVKAMASEAAYTAECEAEATQLVGDYVKSSSAPQILVARAVLEVGADLFRRRQATTGTGDYESLDVVALSIPNDPMRRAYPLLRRYAPGFA